MKKALVIAASVLFTGAILYKSVPAFRHALYYRYFILAHPEVVGGPCGPNCNGFSEYSERPLNHVDTLFDFMVNDTNRIRVSGVIADRAGRPASNVILYIFQANTSGIYPKNGREHRSDTLNGYLRGWMKTGTDGKYAFYSNRPGSYPGTTRMAHIHCVIKEPNLNVYTLPDFVFPEDPFLTKSVKEKRQDQNGGLVIFTGKDANGVSTYTRNLFLGRGVINYPKK